MAYDKVVDSAQLDAGLTSVANGIRNILGSTAKMGLDGMPTQLGTAVSEISTQADLMAQLSTILEGKAAGGGGGFVTGTFCPAEFIKLNGNPYTVNHSLNTMPKFIFVWKDDLFGVTASRTADEIYCVISSAEKVLYVLQQNKTSYGNEFSESTATDWTTSPEKYEKSKVSIGNVTENSFVIGSNVLNAGLNAANYRWVVI